VDIGFPLGWAMRRAGISAPPYRHPQKMQVHEMSRSRRKRIKKSFPERKQAA
jgi:3-methyladenine DNA glycosylase AlkD